MSIAELMLTLKSLPRDEKLQIFHLLAVDLTQRAGVDLLQNGVACPIWTPFSADHAAQSLQRSLEEDCWKRTVPST